MKTTKIILYIVALLCSSNILKANIVWYDGSNAVSYQVEGKAAPVVQQALRLFEGDMELVTGKKAVASKNAAIRIVQGKGNDDGFCISVKDGKIVVEGHNARGAAYGLLELSRMAGVSPWVWWGDVRPHSKNRLSLADDFRVEKPLLFSIVASSSMTKTGAFASGHRTIWDHRPISDSSN